MTKDELKLFSRVAGKPLTSMVGTWENELGSRMTITAQDADGQFAGTYTSTVSSSGQSVTGPVVGEITNDSVGWVVNWSARFKSTTSWAGKVLQDPVGTPIIYTLWNLSRELKDPQDDWWESFLSGSDRFSRQDV